MSRAVACALRGAHVPLLGSRSLVRFRLVFVAPDCVCSSMDTATAPASAAATARWTIHLFTVKRHSDKDTVTQHFTLHANASDSCTSLIDQIEVLLIKKWYQRCVHRYDECWCFCCCSCCSLITSRFPDVPVLYPLHPRKLAHDARDEDPNCRWPYALRLTAENSVGGDDYEPPDADTTPISTFLCDGAALAAEDRRMHD